VHTHPGITEEMSDDEITARVGSRSMLDSIKKGSADERENV
jgi:hypothetical protein